MLQTTCTKKQAQKIATLPTMSERIENVTAKTAEGIYNFRGCPNVAIWDIKTKITGTKNPKKEIIFSFALRAFSIKEGSTIFEEAFSRNLRVATQTKGDGQKKKAGPYSSDEKIKHSAFASEETIKENSEE